MDATAVDSGEAKLEGVDEAPCYYPTTAQFAEPLEFIASIRPEAERYGICRICPPPGWKPAFAHKPDKLKFATKEQDLGKLAGGQRLRRKFTENLRKFLFLIGKPMEAARGGKVFIDSHNSSHGCGPVDMFRLFKEVQRMGGHEAVTRDGGWVALAERMGFNSKAIGLQDAYCTYLADFEAVHNGKGLDFDGVVYTPTVYREKPSVEADIRVGMTLWHFLEEDHGAGRCYHGTVKALRGASNCIVEYDLAERFPEPHGRDGSWDAGGGGGGSAAARGGGSSNGDSAAGGWSGAGSHLDSEGRWSRNFRASSCEEVEPFRVTLPKTQLSTLILNGKSPAAAKLAAHGVVCEVCSIAAASKNVLVVCVACDSAYHLGCVEPALPRMPFHDWFCGDCATDGNTAEDLARGPSGLFSSSTSSPSLPFVSSPSPKKTSKHVAAGSISKPPSASKLPAAEAAAAAAAEGSDTSAPAADTPGGSGESDASAATPEKKRAPGSAVGNGSVGTRKRAQAVSPRPKRAEAAAAAAAPRAENGKSSAGGGGGPAAATSTAAGKHGGGAAAAAAAATLNTPKKEEEEEDGSSSEGGGAEGSASLSAARMRGVSRMKGRALKYGFGNGGVFTLKEFALMADGWRSSYLARRGIGDEATEAEMEAEFWKLVGPDPPEEDVKVLYGSDLDTGAVGSGFPWTRGAVAAPGKPAVEQTERRKPRRGPGTREWDYTSYEGHSYEQDAWNLNCLPTSDGSLLQFLGTQIQGVMVPWLYVGMAFSAFCWHNEDHYLYSINYLHAGSPKKWYGVPGSMAEKFETTVQLMFPELFEAHPDLLMQLVTMAHPTEVSKRGVPVSSTTQREGEFVLTFPQAYHAGFNMGTNCAEAVNFAPPDWIPWGNAAQERYRLHKRKPVFSHEGLVLSLVDILAKNAGDGVHASEELTRFLRDELAVLATHQEEMTKQAQQMGCTRFEPMEKLVERLHGGRKATASAEATAAATSIVRRSSSTCGDKGNGCADGEGASGGGGILEGLATGSAVRGPQCSVCDQYCFLTAVVCDTCDSGGLGRGAPARASSGGGGGGSGGSPSGDGGAGAAARRRHQRRRFACGRHLAELCACPASEYTFYQRKDEAQLRRSAKDLTSSEEYTETWVEEARLALAAAKSTGGGMVNGFRPVKGAKGSGGSSREDGASQLPRENGTGGGKVKLEAQPSSGKADGDSVRPRPANGADCSSSSDGAAEREEETEDLQLSNSSGSSMSVEEDEAPLPSSLLPAGWNERPSLSYIGDLIRVGEELGAPEQTLESLREIVDACAGWVKTIEGILGPDGTATTSDTCAAAVSLFGSAKRAAVAAAAAAATGGGDDADGGGRGGRSGGGGSQRNGGVRGENGGSTTAVKRKEQVPFHKAIKLLSTEAKLPGRPVDTTERLCVAIIAACRLRLQVRSLLGLGEDEHTTAARAMCLTIQEAGRTASPVELASRSVRRHPENGPGGAGDASADSKTSGGGSTGCPRGCSPCRGQGGGSNGSSAVPSSGADSGAASEAPTTTSSRPGSSRTRTRTNVSAPTGTLAAERGTWKLQPWRLWPVHQPAAAALVEPCVSSVVAVPELALLRKALAALAERTDKALRMMDGVASSSASESCGVKRGRGGATAGVGGDSAGDGGGARGRSRGSGGAGAGGKAKPSGAPAAVAGSSRGGGGAGGGVLLGAAHKRRRQDDS